jgi:hypothetical protein
LRKVEDFTFRPFEITAYGFSHGEAIAKPQRETWHRKSFRQTWARYVLFIIPHREYGWLARTPRVQLHRQQPQPYRTSVPIAIPFTRPGMMHDVATIGIAVRATWKEFPHPNEPRTFFAADGKQHKCDLTKLPGPAKLMRQLPTTDTTVLPISYSMA